MSKTTKRSNYLPRIILFIFILLGTFPIGSSCKKQSGNKYILIYSGAVADADGVGKVAEMAASSGYDVEYIAKLNQLPTLLEGAVAFIIGGTSGDTGDLLDDLYGVQEELKTYIEKGGSYLGICGGAYVASKGSQWDDGYETGMGLLDCECFAYDKNYDGPQIISLNWLGTIRTMYYQYGPAFASQTLPANSEILAYYTNENQDVAIFRTKLGAGTLLLCGPHPEADETWLTDDPEPLNAENWTNTHDIFSTVFEQLVAKKNQ